MVNTTRDRWLLVMVSILSAVSMSTTILGTSQILPSPMAEVLGYVFGAILYLLLAGIVARHSLVRRGVAVVCLSVVSIYTSFFAYYDELGTDGRVAAELDQALQLHADLVSAVSPHQHACAEARSEAVEAKRLLEMEIGGGALSGAGAGYGPNARKYAALESEKRIVAERLCTAPDRISSVVASDVSGATPAEIYQSDLAVWEIAPPSWEIERPERGAYVDERNQVALFIPYYALLDQEPPALLAIALALMVDGLGILLGTAIMVPQLEPWFRRRGSLLRRLRGT